MKIAINARVLNERAGGPARYTLNIIKELTKIDRSNQYYILLYDDIKFSFELPKNFIIKIIKIKSKIFFDYMYLPWFSFKYRIDISLFPKNTFSPFVRGKKIPVYHDIVYFEKLGFREFKFFDNLHHRLMIPVAARFSAVDLTVSDFTASRMRTLLNIQPEKIRVIKEGVEDTFRPIKDVKKIQTFLKGLNIKQPFFFYSGSLSPRKNIRTVIEAFIEVREKIPHNIYMTGGDSWRDSDIHTMIVENDLEDRVIKLGYVTEEELILLYNAADCYLYPSLYEGFGLPILEAQACGCPVITGTSASCPEVAGPGALLVDPRKPDELARAMSDIVSDRELREKLIKEGHKNCEHYQWSDTAQRVYELFTEIGEV